MSNLLFNSDGRLSLQDEHLQQALKQAPDHDLAPSDTVREKVFAHVDASLQPKSHGLKRWFANLSSVQLVALSSVATAIIVMFIIYPQVPNDAVWSTADEGEIALSEQVEMKEAESVTSAEAQHSALESFGPKAESPEVASAGMESPEDVSAAPPDKAVARPTVGPMAKKAEKRIATAAPQAAKEKAQLDATESIAENFADDASMMESEAVEAQVLEEADAIADKVPASEPMATASAPQSNAQPEVDAAFANKRSLAPQLLSPTQLAQQDIAAGKLRILLASEVWPEGQSMVDEETGYRIELSAMSKAEVMQYNEAVRSWYRKSQLRE